jgi:hypothetical protein
VYKEKVPPSSSANPLDRAAETEALTRGKSPGKSVVFSSKYTPESVQACKLALEQTIEDIGSVNFAHCMPVAAPSIGLAEIENRMRAAPRVSPKTQDDWFFI